MAKYVVELEDQVLTFKADFSNIDAHGGLRFERDGVTVGYVAPGQYIWYAIQEDSE